MAWPRADRALSLYVFGPLTGLFPGRETRVPILMYHRVPKVDCCSRHPYYCTSTAAPVFEQQIRFLRDEGYTAVSVGEAYEAVQGAKSEEKLVAITFDDGYQDFYTHAFPILSRYGYSATVFLPTAYIGDTPQQFKGIDCLTWGQVRELQGVGVEFGSHTMTHPQLRDVSTAQLRAEVAGSKEDMEQKLGDHVQTFSYPYAFPETDSEFISRLGDALQESGYQAGVSTILGRSGRSDKRLFMRRLPVNSHDDLRLFQAKLEGEYDWLHSIQYAAKMGARRPTRGRPSDDYFQTKG